VFLICSYHYLAGGISKLEVLLGAKTEIDELLAGSKLDNLGEVVNLDLKITVNVPKHPPRSSLMFKHNNGLWPQVFHHSTGEDQREGELDISEEELEKMKKIAEMVWSEVRN
jgi:hypothetical protein